jgi:23S rRNA U2552 (ribose-2'-O)-methylase RlmE/FtsJ
MRPPLFRRRSRLLDLNAAPQSHLRELQENYEPEQNRNQPDHCLATESATVEIAHSDARDEDPERE